ncbi:MAG TPA: hypothetical protein ENN81_09690 [Phycisphaerales bacterium]|nr:hypothetical protein [Phycisphaerales bacterium]
MDYTCSPTELRRPLGRPVLGVCLVVLAFLAGCNAPKDDLMQFDRHIAQADLRAACRFAESKIGKRKTPRNEDLLWTLQRAAIERARPRPDYALSTEYFDRAEEMLKHFDQKNRMGDVVGGVVASDNLAPYMGEEYDGIMVNTYKAMNFMAQGKMDLARVEFNRATERQRRATEKFSAEIRKLNDQMQRGDGNMKIARAGAESDEVRQRLARAYPELDNFAAYPDFVNPFTNYLAAVYYNLMNEPQKAEYELRAVHGMVADNPYVAKELDLTRQDRLDGSVWVIFENGLGPVREEFRLDIPLAIVTEKIKYVGIALPRIRLRGAPCPYLDITADGRTHRTAVVADMDRIVQTEFKKDYPAILTRAIISATGKAALQFVLQDTIGKRDPGAAAVASWLMAGYSMFSTAADVRIWTTLPKNFQIARFAIPADRTLSIVGPGVAPLKVKIPECGSAVVCIKIMTRNSPPVYDVMTF